VSPTKKTSVKLQENQQPNKPEKTALVKAVDLLARTDYSTLHLTRKLKECGYKEEDIKKALTSLTERGYLDDEEACRHKFMLFYNESRKSVRQITAKLMQQGFSAALIAACVPNDTFVREQEAARRCLDVHFKKSTAPLKMLQYLYRRGFSTAVCRASVASFTTDDAD